MEAVIASLANRLDTLVVSIQHVDVDDTDELENYIIKTETFLTIIIQTTPLFWVYLFN